MHGPYYSPEQTHLRGPLKQTHGHTGKFIAQLIRAFTCSWLKICCNLVFINGYNVDYTASTLRPPAFRGLQVSDILEEHEKRK